MVLNSPWGTVDTTSPAYRVGLVHGMLAVNAGMPEASAVTLALTGGETVTKENNQDTLEEATRLNLQSE